MVVPGPMHGLPSHCSVGIGDRGLVVRGRVVCIGPRVERLSRFSAGGGPEQKSAGALAFTHLAESSLGAIAARTLKKRVATGLDYIYRIHDCNLGKQRGFWGEVVSEQRKMLGLM